MLLLYIQTQMLRIASPYIDPSINRVEFHSQYSAVSNQFDHDSFQNTMIFLCLFMKNSSIDKLSSSMSDLVAIFQYSIMLYSLFSFSLWAYNFIAAVVRSNVDTLRSFTITMRLLKIFRAQKMLTYNQYLQKEIGEELYRQYVRDEDTDNLNESLQNKSSFSENSGRPNIEYSSRIINSSNLEEESPAAQSSRRALYSVNESDQLSQVRIMNSLRRAVKTRIFQASSTDSIAYRGSDRS